MILVAGLVIAALAIAAAFYYSVRPGRSRVGADAGPGRAGAAGLAGSRGRNSSHSSSGPMKPQGSARPAGSASSRTAGRTGPEPTPGSAGVSPMTGPGEDPAPLIAGSRAQQETSTGPRRRVAWRKGSDVDQELWPVETFGGVSDEQFWDDMAADRPLASTARTAQADSGPGTQPARAFPATRPTAADHTAVQAAVQAAVRSAQAPARSSPTTTQAYPARTQPPATATQPVRAAQQPTGSRGRRNVTAGGPGTDEDPLTSPAYSLRARGAVDGHSHQASYRADPLGSDGYSTGSSASVGTTGTPAYQPGPGSAGRPGGTAAYPYQGQPRSHSAQATQSAGTPPYGNRYGYRNPAGPADDLTRATGNRGNGRPGGNGIGEGTWDSYRAQPPVNGYRGPYDPRGNGRY
jgi:hypothetical protein